MTLIDGVKCLHVYTDEFFKVPEVIMMIGAVLAGLAVLYFYLYYEMYKDKVVRFMAPMLVVACFMIFGCVASEPQIDIYYKCTISEDASFEKVYERFEVTSVRGDIYTLKMRNSKGEFWDLDRLVERVNGNANR